MKKSLLLSTATAALLAFGVSGTAFADSSKDNKEQNEWAAAEELEFDPSKPEDESPDLVHKTIDHQLSGNTFTLDEGQTRENVIDDGTGDNSAGISHTQQNNGSANALGIATNVQLNTSDGDYEDDVDQQIGIGHSISNVTVTDAGAGAPADRTNTIDGSFNNAAGINNVQQNNGDHNSLAIADAVVANIDDDGDPQLPGALDGAESVDDSEQRVLLRGQIGGGNPNNAPNVLSIDESNEEGGARTNEIGVPGDGSFDGSSGMASVQQNNGSNNLLAIGNAVIADINAEENDSGDEDVDEMIVDVEGKVLNSASASSSEPGTGTSDTDRDNAIDGSFDNFQGIANAQQNNGDNNVMNVGNAVRANLVVDSDLVDDTGDDIDDVDVLSVKAEGIVKGNSTDPFTLDPSILDGKSTDKDQDRLNSMTGSFQSEGGDAAAGIFNVQQNNGDNNVINSANGVVAVLDTESTDADDVMAGAYANAMVQNNFAFASENVDRENEIDNSFTGASGIATVQQNNGDNNAINAAKAVVAYIDEGAEGFDGHIMSDTALMAVVTGNQTTVEATNGADPGYLNTVSGSFSGFQGISTVQQNNGSNNAIQSAITVVANIDSN